ncbi:MAG TPA: MlaD family protein, partial [Longimicrobiales bacterium]|nr:MlaD family protein [Longimicrobiales bacterium]
MTTSSDEYDTGGAGGAGSDRESAWLRALPSRKRGREVWLGLFVILAVLATMTALFTLTDPSLFRGRYETNVQVPEASGIRRGDPVQMRGVNIGRVKAFQIRDRSVIIRLEIEGEYP